MKDANERLTRMADPAVRLIKCQEKTSGIVLKICILDELRVG